MLRLESPRQRPAPMEALPERHRSNSDFSSPVSGDHSSAFELNMPILARVSSLLSFRRPPTILWLIVAVIINAVNRKTFGARPHVGVEGGERISPSFTNCNSSVSIIFIGRIIGIFASLNHSYPHSILRSMGQAVRGISANANIPGNFPIKATA